MTELKHARLGSCKVFEFNQQTKQNVKKILFFRKEKKVIYKKRYFDQKDINLEKNHNIQ